MLTISEGYHRSFKEESSYILTSKARARRFNNSERGGRAATLHQGIESQAENFVKKARLEGKSKKVKVRGKPTINYRGSELLIKCGSQPHFCLLPFYFCLSKAVRRCCKSSARRRASRASSGGN
jgi:hypothetical protein